MLNYLKPAWNNSAPVPQEPRREVLVERLMLDADWISETDLLPKGNVVLCGDEGLDAGLVRRLVRDEDALLHTIGAGRSDLQWIAAGAEDIDLVMVDADFLGDVGDTIDFCMRIRRAMPDMPIILVSSEIRGDDFTCERMGACDVTLKSGFSRAKLEQGISVAYQNNLTYQKSRH